MNIVVSIYFSNDVLFKFFFNVKFLLIQPICNHVILYERIHLLIILY